ncbi:putative ABC transport system permease protein [Glycomyces sambucus]|uniref:Putative ABC transport system permease protein n=1 Tax=Glycomyces sambucus TaxID=380244 RepID=A0A1G9I8P0_9ACTN|nr:FtsX-like permease family protein [Glycomyces sambucus]SDL21173.1 putative ABC transport system permease protein [Glycomyces sambucus]
MTGLALRSLAHHRVSAIATGLVATAGIALVTAMAGLLGTGLADATAAADRAFLVQFPLILGGWVLAIVLFAMVSTIGVALQGRAGEIAGLRLIGATPPQVRAMVAAETVAVTALAAVPGTALGYLLGAGLLAGIRSTGLIADATAYAPGAGLLLLGALLVLAAAAAAAWLGSRAVAARSPVAGLGAGTGRRRGGRGRRTTALVVVGAGLASSYTVLAVDPASILTTALTGPGCVLVAVGLCLLAPELVALADFAFDRVPRLRAHAPGHLAARNLAAAPERARPAVTFLTLFVGVAAGTLGMQGIENEFGAAGSDGQVLAAINYLVVALIALFMAIALSNNLVASIARRAPEFASMSLIGATAGQSRRMLLGEVAASAIVSAAAGGLGALVSILPFAIAKTGGPAAAFAPVPFVLTVAVGAGVTLGVTAVVGRRTIRAATA